jgi:hypothetical protein
MIAVWKNGVIHQNFDKNNHNVVYFKGKTERQIPPSFIINLLPSKSQISPTYQSFLGRKNVVIFSKMGMISQVARFGDILTQVQLYLVFW